MHKLRRIIGSLLMLCFMLLAVSAYAITYNMTGESSEDTENTVDINVQATDAPTEKSDDVGDTQDEYGTHGIMTTSEDYGISLFSTATVTASGKCGTNLTWTLYNDGLLEINGTGAMPDYTVNSMPWYNYKSSITSLKIGDSVTSIGGNAFFQHTKITNIDIGSGVTTVRSNAFSYCSGLTEVQIPDNVNKIESWAFAYCNRLKNIVIGSGVTSIYSDAFEYCSKSKSILVKQPENSISGSPWSATNETVYWNVKDWGYCGGEGDGTNLVWILDYDGTLQFFGSGNMANYTSSSRAPWFKYRSDIVKVTFEFDDVNIGDFAFKELSNLTSSLPIPNECETIGKYAYAYCSGVETINIPETVTFIDNYAFQDCTGAKNLYIPNSVQSTGYNLLWNSKLELVEIDKVKGQLPSLSGWPNTATVVYTRTLKYTAGSTTYIPSGATATVTVEEYKNRSVVKTLTSGTDYTVSYSNNKSAGTGNYTVKFTGNYSEVASYTGTYTISTRAIYSATVGTIASQQYTGSAITPVPTITYSGATLVNGTDFTLSYSNNTALGTATITIKGKGNYSGTTTKTFTITARAISSATIGTVSSYTYTGSAFSPTPTITYNGMTLVNGTDYTLSYTNNTNSGTGTITITGKGNYSGTTTKTFIISARAISSTTVGTVANQTYTGSALTPTPTITYNNMTLVNGTDYSLSYSNNTNAGTATITITGKGNYTSTTTKTFTVSERAISSATVGAVSSYTYTGSAFTPTPTIIYNGKTLTNGTDYSLSYTNNVNAGTATITITGKGNYNGTTTKNFTINSRAISSTTLGTVANQVYSGNSITPTLTITYNSKTLVSGTDYSLLYTNNTNAGTGTITVTGLGNFSGTTTKTFNISACGIASTTISTVPSQTYTGSELTPAPTLTYNGKSLVSGTDYNLSYANNISAGTAKITITGAGNFTGTTSKTFTISTRAISAATIGSVASQTYNGSEITPVTTITYNGKTLVKDTDYTLQYSNNINKGTATISITGKGNFSGNTTKTFTIVAKGVENVVIDVIQDQEYTGNQITPLPTITDTEI